MDNASAESLALYIKESEIMGKYRKGRDDEDKRTVTVSTRLTPAETVRLDNLRGKIQRGTYLRLILTDNVPPYIPAINRHAYAELARIGSNINQIAQAFNVVESIPEDITDIQSLLAELRLSLIKLRKE